MLVGRERFDRDAGMGRGFFGDDFSDFYGMTRPSFRRRRLAGS